MTPDSTVSEEKGFRLGRSNIRGGLLGGATLLLLALIAGCVKTELRITNHTGGSIQVYSGHTKRATRIPNDETAIIPHTAGTLIIISEQDIVWEYDAFDIVDFPKDTTRGVHRLTVSMSIEHNGTIALPSGQKIEPTRVLSPTKRGN